METISENLNEFRYYLRQFVNKNENELAFQTGFNSKAKSKLFMLSSLIVQGFKGKSIIKAIFDHEKIVLKTIQIKENGNPKEAMSFSPIIYLDIVKEERSSSKIRDYFNTTTFLFFIFKQTGNENKLIKIGLWRMPVIDLDGELQKVWSDTVNLIKSGNIIKFIDEKGRIVTNFPKESETINFHVRPHGSCGHDVIPLPTPDKNTGYTSMSKQSFWFNHSYVKSIVKYSVDI